MEFLCVIIVRKKFKTKSLYRKILENIDMDEKTFEAGLRIVKYKGLFDFEELFHFIQKWMKDRYYEFHEKKYKQKPLVYFDEHEITWYAEKKVTDYIMYRIDIFIHLYEAEVKEVEIEGKKKKIMDARMQIDINGHVITDYSGEFEKSGFAKKIESFINKRILYKELLLKYLDSFDYELYDLETDVKKFLKMESKESAY